MSNHIHDILQNSLRGDEISRDQCLELMKLENYTPEMYELFYTANRLTRERSNGVGQIHAQIGIDYTACPRKCGFCIFGGIPDQKIELNEEDILIRVKNFERAGAPCDSQVPKDLWINSQEDVSGVRVPSASQRTNIDVF